MGNKKMENPVMLCSKLSKPIHEEQLAKIKLQKKDHSDVKQAKGITWYFDVVKQRERK